MQQRETSVHFRFVLWMVMFLQTQGSGVNIPHQERRLSLRIEGGNSSWGRHLRAKALAGYVLCLQQMLVGEAVIFEPQH